MSYATNWMKGIKPLNLQEAIKILEEHNLKHWLYPVEEALRIANELNRQKIYRGKMREALSHAIGRDHEPSPSICDPCALAKVFDSGKAFEWLSQASFDWDQRKEM